MHITVDARDIQPIIDKAVAEALDKFGMELKSLVANAAANRLKSTAEAAAQLGVCQKTVRNLVCRGELIATRIGDTVRFSQDDIDAFVSASKSTNAGEKATASGVSEGR